MGCKKEVDVECYREIAGLGDVTPARPLRATLDGHEIALWKIEGQIYATDNICTHAYASLADGFLEGDCVECPLHEACFNVRTGKALSAPATVDLRIYKVQIEGERIFIEWPAAGSGPVASPRI